VYFEGIQLEYPEDEDMPLENPEEYKDDLLVYPEDSEDCEGEDILLVLGDPEDSENILLEDILLEDPGDCEEYPEDCEDILLEYPEDSGDILLEDPEDILICLRPSAARTFAPSRFSV
jgi:hypothetical protein